MTGSIFKETEGGRRVWVFVLIAAYFFAEAAFFREAADRLAYLIFGTAVLGFGLAELVPRDRTRPAGAFRIGGVALMFVIVAVRALQLAGVSG